ncbi:MAG TPA: dockerin type I repeat-containing protein [Chthoniobacterales bacterium]
MIDPSSGERDSCKDCQYQLVTGNGGSRLRVALNLVLDYRRDRSVDEGVHPDAAGGKAFKLQILDEDQNLIMEGATFGNAYAIELLLCFNKAPGENCESYRLPDGLPCGTNPDGTPKYVCEPLNGFSKAVSRSSAGTWTIKVVVDGNPLDPRAISGWDFDLRAKLESAPPLEPTSGQLLPNLRSQPPFELTFCEPAVTVGFSAGNTPICGSASNGLTTDEEARLIQAEIPGGNVKPFHRGIRFSVGPANLGDGFMDIRTDPDDLSNPCDTLDPAEPAHVCRQAYQRVYSADGSFVDRKAGTMEFHHEHNHWHYKFFTFELYKVTFGDPTKPCETVLLSKNATGPKVGFCPTDEHLADWNSFNQFRRLRWQDERIAERGDAGDQNCVNPTNPKMGLDPGWGEYYEWARVEQFVEFPINNDQNHSPVDGDYLLRVTIDGENALLETDEHDNSSYALFKVRNGVIEPIMSAYGDGPCGELISIASRKQHGYAGFFDIDLPVAGTTGIECRSGDTNGAETMVFRFANRLTSVSRVAVKSGPGTITSDGIGSDAHEYFVNLTGVTKPQLVTVGLTNISDAAGNFGANVIGSVNVLPGDTNADTRVNIVDTNQTKANSGSLTNADNFRTDVNLDGRINVADTNFVKAHAGSSLPAARPQNRH